MKKPKLTIANLGMNGPARNSMLIHAYSYMKVHPFVKISTTLALTKRFTMPFLKKLIINILS